MKFLFLIIAFCAAINSYSQTLPIPRDITVTYDKGTRSATGKPGKNYWQNTAGYNLDIHFDPESRALQGIEAIEYVNNSPDTLKEICFKLYPNIYQKGAPRSIAIETKDLMDGLVIDEMIIGNNTINLPAAKGTNLIIDSIILLPRSKTRITVRYHYTLNKTSHIRTGEIEPGADFIAYFFPRIAVYDDIDGWNKNPYLGTQEFYNDFCNFKIAVTVPKNYIVWCTGNLLNSKDVFTKKYNDRLQQAEQSDAVITIIDSSDIAGTDITAPNPENTWHFEATDVTDAAFAVSNHYIWQATSLVVDKATGRRTRVDAVFNPAHKDFFDVIQYARKTVEAMSFTFPAWPYPYPHETVFDGLDQMEYPMMVNDNPLADKAEAIELTDHEIFHTMFPFYMGINETKYGWMDEGWATIGEWLISPIIDTTIEDNFGVQRYAMNAGNEQDVPITTLSTQLNGLPFFLNSYPKPAFGYLYIKDMLGDALFTKALHYYLQQWHGKHPMPYDFFNCMNAGAGKNLNWFWKRWFFDGGYPDLGITKVSKTGINYSILVTNKGGKPVPVDATVYYTDGAIEKLHKTIECWMENNRQMVVPLSTSKTISKIVLGSLYVPDTNEQDNIYTP